jgi:amidase
MELTFASTARLAAAIRTREVSAVEVLDAHVAQIERHDGALNAVVTRDFERARARAREADQALARGLAWGPLHGVPFTLKDAHATAGVRTTTGFPPFADLVPGEDGTVAARLKGAGGILMGKTNVAEMLADFQTGNPIFGRTSNPWNRERTPGGSSGGSAAAVAAGMTPFDVGTDMSSSIRIPAHFCGVFALKPTETRVSLDGLIPGLSGPRSVRRVSCIGPLARAVEDLTLIYRIIAGPDGRDTEVAPVPVEEVPALKLEGMRLAVAPTFPGFPVAASIREAIGGLARRLGEAGALVEQAELPALDFSRDLARTGALIGMMVGAFQPSSGRPVTVAAYLEALDQRDRSIRAWDAFFDRWDALLCPAAMVTAFPHCEAGSPLRVDGEAVDYGMVSAHGSLFNYSGHPAVVVPCGLDDQRLPLGAQIVGKRWGESRLLGIASAVSPLGGAFVRPPGF